MRKVQILLLVALLVLNLAAAAYADVTITLNGTLDPLVLDVSVPVTSLTYALPFGELDFDTFVKPGDFKAVSVPGRFM